MFIYAYDDLKSLSLWKLEEISLPRLYRINSLIMIPAIGYFYYFENEAAILFYISVFWYQQQDIFNLQLTANLLMIQVKKITEFSDVREIVTQHVKKYKGTILIILKSGKKQNSIYIFYIL